MEKKQKVAMYTIAPVLMFCITFYIYYLQASVPDGGDIVKHMSVSMSLSDVLRISDCGWHFVCWLLYATLPIPIDVAASAATACFNAMTAVIVIWLIDQYFDHCFRSAVYPTLVALAGLLVGPCYLRFYNPRYYLGQGSPNIWHNPTSTAVRPFMLLVGILTIRYWECGRDETVELFGKQRKKKVVCSIGLMILLFISTVVKPSFLMVYCPVCGIMALIRLIKGKGRNFLTLVAEHLYFIPSLLLFLWQYIKIFVFGGALDTSGGIEIAFFKVARLYAPSVVFSLILKMAFPFLVILIWRKLVFHDRLFQLVFCQFLMGLAITWTFAETGTRAKHGNFGWGNILASSFLWLMCLIFYAREFYRDRDQVAVSAKLKAKYGIPAVFLLWHLLGGITSLGTYFKEFT